jgi:HAD superfamily hydrolase (TIGR01549 family)
MMVMSLASKLKLKNFCWDFDGTLFDTYPEMTISFQEAAARLGLTLTADEVYRQLRQTSVGQTIRHFIGEGPQALLMKQKFHAIEAKNCLQARPFPGIKDFSSYLASQGCQQFLLTHRNQSAWNLLKRAGLKEYFTGGVTAEMGFARKPDPQSINYLSQQFNLQPDLSVMIGDRPLDVLAGQRAGFQGWLFDPDGLIAMGSENWRFTTYNQVLECFLSD